ncbi:c-type cytochrome [Paenibacillus guangzhouensis]|uniref:c-type cytochrome n=1 Tax=Paenibacillus guangzhouensis TaxID=1473112 RepID=UPI001D11E3FE|nr:cytochrome c [Paenibacillus guangzhouensis]
MIERKVINLKRTAAILFSCMIIISLSACGGATSKAPETNKEGAGAGTGTTTTTKVDAEAVFKANCVSCHGNNLEGAVGPNLQKVGGKLSKGDIDAVVTNGRGGMPSFKGQLSSEEIAGIADWLSTKK